MNQMKLKEQITDNFRSFLLLTSEQQLDFIRDLNKKREKTLIESKKRRSSSAKPKKIRKAPDTIDPELREIFNMLPEKSKRLFCR